MTRSTATLLDDRILTVRGMRVLLDADLAVLYGVSAKVFNQAVKRNIRRFPAEFRFRLTAEEVEDLRSRRAGPESGPRRRRHRPWAFTQEGVLMLSGILDSSRAMVVGVAIMRAFVDLRRSLAERGDVLARLETLGEGVRMGNATTDRNTWVVFETLRRLLADQATTTVERIGFRLQERGRGYRAGPDRAAPSGTPGDRGWRRGDPSGGRRARGRPSGAGSPARGARPAGGDR